MSNGRVVVVGAGCAGLSATYTLRKQGVEVVAFEANDTAGGRCRSISEQGYTFSVGAGSTEPQWETTFQYLTELGLMDKVFSLQRQRYGFFVNGKIRTVFTGGSLWETIKATPENVRFLFTVMPFKAYPQIIKVFLALRKYMKLVDTETHNFDALAEISNMSTEEFVLKHGGPEALEWMFHPFLATMVLARPRDISVAHPISLFSLMKGMRSLEGGLGTLTEALYEKVRDSVRLSTPISEIVIENNRVTGVQTEEGFVEADHVVCAVDAVLARQLIPDLPDAMRKVLETCQYSSTYYYQFGLDRHLVPGKVDMFVLMTPASAGTVVSWVARGSRAHEKPVMICATRGWEDDRLAQLSPEERRRMVIKEIQGFFPEFPSEPVITKLFRWERAVNLESPGQFIAIQDLLNNHMHDVRGLHLAGEYLFLIASTEGALKTGKQAAERVVAEIKGLGP
jgi:protoporphyrinogen oxidase